MGEFSDDAIPSDDETSEPQKVRMSNVTARLPPSVAAGVLSTGAIVVNGRTETVIDFVQRMGPAGKVVSRIVLPKQVIPGFVAALEQNFENYTNTFGEPPQLPRGTGKQQPIQDIYDELKIPDEDLSGHYANSVAIRHTPAEFVFDFIANVFPNAAVSARVFLSPSRVSPLLGLLKKNCGMSDDEHAADN